MKKALTTRLPLAILCSAFVLAQGAGAEAPSGLYLGGNYGGFKARGGDFDDERDLIEGVVGWQLNPYLGIEGNYIDFGKYGLAIIFEQRGCIYCKKMHEEVFPIPEIDAYINDHYFVIQMNLFGDVEVFGVSRNQDDDSLFYGLGAAFRITDGVGLTAEYKRFDIEYDSAQYPVTPSSDDTDLDTLTVGVRVSF